MCVSLQALGSIFVELATGHGVWHGVATKEAQKRIAAGELPPILETLSTSTDQVNQVLWRAIEMCYVYEPKERPNAKVVADFLKQEARHLKIDWEAKFSMKDV